MGEPKVSAGEFKRTFSGRAYVGAAFFSTHEECKQAGTIIRQEWHVPTRTVVISPSTGGGRGYVGGYETRYILMMADVMNRTWQGTASAELDLGAVYSWLDTLPSNMGEMYFEEQE